MRYIVANGDSSVPPQTTIFIIHQLASRFATHILYNMAASTAYTSSQLSTATGNGLSYQRSAVDQRQDKITDNPFGKITEASVLPDGESTATLDTGRFTKTYDGQEQQVTGGQTDYEDSDPLITHPRSRKQSSWGRFSRFLGGKKHSDDNSSRVSGADGSQMHTDQGDSHTHSGQPEKKPSTFSGLTDLGEISRHGGGIW